MREFMGTDSITKTKTLNQVKEPPRYKVIYMNDDVTTAEFVIESLVVIFNMSRDDALTMTEKIHSEGSAVVAVLPYELAEQKGIEVSIMAKRNGFPLVIKLEADT
jgi:ATP-dependent Clp protease adaptor protein ClpS